MPDCLANIVGLTDIDCNCYEGDQPVDWDDLNASETGFYLTDPEFGFPIVEEINGTGNCGSGTVFDMLEKARTKALNAFRADLGAAIMRRHRNAVQFRGTIGKLNSGGLVTIPNTYAGVQILPRPIHGAKFYLEAIYLGLNVSDTVTVTIASNEDEVDTPLFTPQTVNIATTANKYTRHALATPIELDFWRMTAPQELRYFIYYTPPAGSKAMSNTFTCCGNKPNWRRHMEVYGLATDDLTQAGGMLASANGIVLEGYTLCSEVDWLCRLDSIGGYSTKQLVGRAVQHKGGAFLVSGVLDSQQINRFTLKPKEELYARRDYLQKEYMNAVDWIANNLPIEAMDCLECKSAKKHESKALLV